MIAFAYVVDQRFARSHRLLARAEFLEIYAQGHKVHGRWVVLFGRPRPQQGPWRLGLTATRKIGKACVRNRLRRRGREFFRLHAPQIPAGWDFVVNFKHAAVSASSAQIDLELSRLLGRLPLAPPADPTQPPAQP